MDVFIEIPRDWLTRLIEAKVSFSGRWVSVYLWQLHKLQQRSYRIKVRPKLRRDVFGINDRTWSRALQELETADLIRVERKKGQASFVVFVTH